MEEEETAPRSSRRASPGFAAFLSFLWPGLGQVYVHRRRTALLFALPMVGVLVWAILQLAHGALWLSLAMLGSDYAMTIALVAAAVGVWRAASVLHAFIGTPRARATSRVDRGVLAVLLIVVVASSGFVTMNAWATADFDRRVASNDFSSTAIWDASVEGSPDPSAEASGPNGTPIPYYVEPAITPAPLAHRVTILLTGLDFMTGLDHALNDSILVVSLDTDSNQVALISVPRDTSSYSLYWGGTGGIKINALQVYVRNHWLVSPDPPMTTLIKEVGFLIGIPVNYYAQIDMNGFLRIIDLVGGVDVVNPAAFYDGHERREWPVGPMHLDAKSALLYVRSRYGDNDYKREARQQALLTALVKKLASPSMAFQFQQVLGMAGSSIQTNFPLDTVKDYAPLIDKYLSGGVSQSQCVLGPPYSWHPDSATTNGAWTSRLNLDKVANLSVQLFGNDSSYYGQAGVTPTKCEYS
jgi:LCP family protein required for cell wall assembly